MADLGFCMLPGLATAFGGEAAAQLTTCSHRIPQRALNHQFPIQALQAWQQKKPELFIKPVYKQAGLDM